MKFPNPLEDTGDHDAVEDITPERMEELAQVPASKAYVITTCLKCWVKTWVRKMRIRWALVFGFGVCLNLLGYVSAKLAFEAAVEKSVQKVTPAIIRQEMIYVLREHKIISALPSPAPGESVAALLGGSP